MIEVRGLSKYYGRMCAISNLTFSIKEGSITGFLGLNGAGKSTALKILAGFLLPTSGEVLIDGVDLIANPETLRAKIGFLPETPPSYPEMTVSGFLIWVARLRGLSKGEIKGRLPSVLERTGLQGRQNQTIGTLSLGYQKRLGIAQAICHDPKLVILDEPISGLDPVQIVQMRAMIRSLGGDHTVLISSHILPEVKETCDHLLVLKDGELVAQGSENEIFNTLRGGRKVEVTLRGDGDKALGLIKSLPMVVSVSALERKSGGVFPTFRVELKGGEVEALSKAIVEGGFGLRRLNEGDNALEEAFLAVTGGALPPKQGGGEA